MSETSQMYLELESGGSGTETGLRGVINVLQDEGSSQKEPKDNRHAG